MFRIVKTDDFIQNREKCNEIIKDINEFKFLIPIIGNF